MMVLSYPVSTSSYTSSPYTSAEAGLLVGTGILVYLTLSGSLGSIIATESNQD